MTTTIDLTKEYATQVTFGNWWREDNKSTWLVNYN